MKAASLPNAQLHLLPKWKLILFVLLGFFLYISCFSLSLVITVSSLALVFFIPVLIKVLFIPLGSVYFLMKDFFVKVPQTQNLRLYEKDVPQLFNLITTIKKELRTPKIHCIYMTSELNAAVRETGWILIPFFKKRCLEIGLPLLVVTTPQEFRAILTHELSHFSKKHASFSSFLYVNRKRLIKVYEHISNKKTLSPIKKILTWYLTRFDQYALNYKKAQEYEADKNAAQYVGKDSMAKSLLRVHIMEDYLFKKLWPEIWKRTITQPFPNKVEPYTFFLTALKQPLEKELFDKLVSLRLKEKSTAQETHPCLQERLQALEFTAPPKLASLKLTAAEKYFGNALQTALDYIHTLWVNEVFVSWAQAHAEAKELKRQRALYEKNTDLSASELENYAYALLKLTDDTDKVEELLITALALEPTHPGANYLYGHCLTKKYDDNCINYFMQPAKNNPLLKIESLERTIRYLLNIGRKEEAESYFKEYEEEKLKHQKAHWERNHVQHTDVFKAADLPIGVNNLLTQLVSVNKTIQEAFLVEKVVEFFPQEKFYLLICQVKNTSKVDQSITEKINHLKLEKATLELFFIESGPILAKAKGVENSRIKVNDSALSCWG